jgi:hypothetical protein
LATIDKDDPGIAPGMYQPRPGDDDSAVREATTKLEDRHITALRWSANLAGVTHQSLEIALRVAMQVPVGRIKWHIDMWDYARCLIDLSEQHQAIGTTAFDPTHVVIRRPQPGLGLGDYPLALAHTAVSGVGM